MEGFVLNKLPDKFCIMPFTHMNIKLTEGKIAACWRYQHNLGDYRTKSLSEIWNGEGYKQIRKDFLEGKFNPGCKSCIDYESKNLESTRTTCNANFANKYGSLDKFITQNLNSDLTVKNQPLSMEIRFGNLCNLRCLHCSSAYSSKWSSAIKNNTWLKNLNPQFKYTSINKLEKSMVTEAKANIKNLNHLTITGGEPLIHPDHLPFLHEILEYAPNINLEYNTNFNVDLEILKKYMEVWSKFKKVTVRISIDASKQIYSYFRTYGNYELIENNVDYFRKNYSSTNYDLCMTITTNIFNITKIKDCFDEITTNFGCRFHASLVQSPVAISIINLPYELKISANEQLDTIYHMAKPHEQRFIKMIKNYLNSSNNSLKKFNNDTRDYILGMDKLNNTNYFEFYPEFVQFM